MVQPHLIQLPVNSTGPEQSLLSLYNTESPKQVYPFKRTGCLETAAVRARAHLGLSTMWAMGEPGAGHRATGTHLGTK